jgi:hypothetical protein
MSSLSSGSRRRSAETVSVFFSMSTPAPASGSGPRRHRRRAGGRPGGRPGARRRPRRGAARGRRRRWHRRCPPTARLFRPTTPPVGESRRCACRSGPRPACRNGPVTSVASKSNVSVSGPPAATHTWARAMAAARAMPRNSAEATAPTARHAVACEATGANNSSCSRRTAMSDRQSAPSAMATARWVSTTPGSWVCHEIPQPAIACDMAKVNPDRSAASASNPVPHATPDPHRRWSPAGGRYNDYGSPSRRALLLVRFGFGKANLPSSGEFLRGPAPAQAKAGRTIRANPNTVQLNP